MLGVQQTLLQETERSRKDTDKVTFCLALFPPRAVPEQAFESTEFIWKVQDTPAGRGEVQQKKGRGQRRGDYQAASHWGRLELKTAQKLRKGVSDTPCSRSRGKGAGLFTSHSCLSLAEGCSWGTDVTPKHHRPAWLEQRPA